jgi:hypothetical protein
MTQEQKEILLKDLCGRLPYGVKCNVGDDNPYTLSRIEIDDKNGHLLDFIEMKYGLDMQVYLSEVKPYLFPMSSMTKEQKNEYHELVGGMRMAGTSVLINFEFLEDFFYRNHLDSKGLISMGLALDATGKNIYIDYAQR